MRAASAHPNFRRNHERSNGLNVIEKQNAMAVFTTKEQLDPIIEAIEKEARSLVPDLSTRKAVTDRIHGAQVARSKT
jgi:hypothetical protein